MHGKNKKIWTIAFIFSFLSLGTVFAAGSGLSQEYPSIGGVTPEAGATFFVYLYNIAVAGGAFLGAAALLKEGLKILTAGENAGKISEARERFGSIVFGLGVLASSYLMLTAINPELNKIQLPQLKFTPENQTSTIDPNSENPTVNYTEIPIGSIIESILNPISEAPQQVYNYSTVVSKPTKPSTEEKCYLYNKEGETIDKNRDGYITELDEYQGLDFSVCMNSLLVAMEYKISRLNDGNYKCGLPGGNDEDSILNIPGWDKSIFEQLDQIHDPYKENGYTQLGIDYHDWDAAGSQLSAASCRYGTCTLDGTTGPINLMKEFIRNGCTCSACEGAPVGGTAPAPYYCHGGPAYCDVYCSSDSYESGGDGTRGLNSRCCGGPRGRDAGCSNQTTTLLDDGNPYVHKDPCTTRAKMDCMRTDINGVVFGLQDGDKINCEYNQDPACPGQDDKTTHYSSGFDPTPCYPAYGCKLSDTEKKLAGSAPVGDLTLTGGRDRLLSFKTYFEKRLADLQKAEEFLAKDKRLEVYTRAEMQTMQQSSKELYKFSQDEIGFPSNFTYETKVYGKEYNCKYYENPEEIKQKNVYEDDANRKAVFNCTQDNTEETKLVKIKTGELIHNLNISGDVEANDDTLTNAQKKVRICANGALEDISKESNLGKYYDFETKCPEGGGGQIVAYTGPVSNYKRSYNWNDDLYEKGGVSYLDENKNQYYTGEEIGTDGDPLTFYTVKNPKENVDPFYTGRDKMPYFFQKGFIDFSQSSENSAIDTETVNSLGGIMPSLIPAGQLSYHTKIYAKQMIRNIDRTLEQVDAAIASLDNIANTFVDGDNHNNPYKSIGDGTYGCDCRNCNSHSDCYCADPCPGGCCYWDCSNSCSTCKTSSKSTCSTCTKISRYYKFMTEEDRIAAIKADQERAEKFKTAPVFKVQGNEILNPEDGREELFVKNVIRDNLPNSIKLHIENRSCPVMYNSVFLVGASTVRVKRQYESKLIATTEVEWKKGKVFISSSAGISNVTADDLLIVKNLTNGKEKKYGPISDNIWSGGIDITSLFSEGKNKIEIYVQDHWGGYIGTSDLYLLTENVDCKCTGGKNYTPPAGYVVKECNAWDNTLKEEKSCSDYSGDITVTLTPG